MGIQSEVHSLRYTVWGIQSEVHSCFCWHIPIYTFYETSHHLYVTMNWLFWLRLLCSFVGIIICPVCLCLYMFDHSWCTKVLLCCNMYMFCWFSVAVHIVTVIAWVTGYVCSQLNLWLLSHSTCLSVEFLVICTSVYTNLCLIILFVCMLKIVGACCMPVAVCPPLSFVCE